MGLFDFLKPKNQLSESAPPKAENLIRITTAIEAQGLIAAITRDVPKYLMEVKSGRREWRALPENDRQSDWHATCFAMKIKDKYKLRHSGSDRYLAVHQIITRYQNLIGAPLR